jgi:predicted ATPase/class 3 adenylate cyclase
MSELRALLLTDVVDSTRLSEQLGDAVVAQLWASHDRLARDLLPAWRGREIDKTDGMLLLFESAHDAVGYATAYHAGLAGLPVPLRARAGLHVGPVILRSNTEADVALGAKPLEVDGLAKPTAARVMALAQGGQTLLTAEAQAALGPAAPHLKSHGHWVMRGLSEPMEVFEAGSEVVSLPAPVDGEKAYRVVRHGERWLPIARIPNNLPQQLSSFVGRERELHEVKALLGRTRLLMLLGMGGLGKTRLSLQVGGEVMHQFPDGVWFLDLAPIRDGALVIGEAAQVLGVREEPGHALLETVCAHLKSLRMLLIVDNCEHLVQASAQLCHAILRAAPGVRILASSREALHIPGEQAYPVLPLPVPQRDDGLQALSRSTAVRLFMDRARLHKPSFALNEREAPAIAELVARLEGIPLAIEIAAARVRSLSIADINARLKDRYKLLTGGGRVVLERQQTLRALVDWSYELLTSAERNLLNRLCVFSGGFDLPAAEQVCGVEPLDPLDVMDLLGSLVEKSLVMMDDSLEAARYRMLETVRDYGREKLAASGEGAAMAARHCEHYFVFAKAARDGLRGPEQAEWVSRLETDLDNVRAGIALALAGGVDPFIAVKLAVALMSFWMLRGYTTEGRSVVRAALALPPIEASDLARAHALYVGACLASAQSDPAEARQMLERCLQLRRGLGNAFDIASTLSTLALVRLEAGDTEGVQTLALEALAIFRSLGRRQPEAVVLLQLGQIALYAEEDQAAREYLEQGVALARQVGNRETEASCELWLGVADFDAGQMAAAERRLTRSLEVCRDAADKRGEAHAMSWLGRIDLEAGNLPGARARLAASLQALTKLEMRAELLECLDDMARLGRALDDGGTARNLTRAVESARERLGLRRSPRRQRAWAARGGPGLEPVDEPRVDPVATPSAPDLPGPADSAEPAWDLSEAVGRSLQLAGRP